MSDRSKRRTWLLADHLCRDCGGRVLQCATGGGMTGGGNPIWKCADCGQSGASMFPSFCWCEFSHRNNHESPYQCVSFEVLKERPELEEAFRACGCDPSRGEVGIVLKSDIRRLASSKPA